MPLCIACRLRIGRNAKFCSRCGAGQPVDHQHSRNSSAQALERRFLTVLFCDLVGSTELATALDPEKLADIILTYREIMQAQIAKAGGAVAQYLGDGLLAYFGYPNAQDDDASRAVGTAISMLEVVPLLEARFKEHLSPRLRIQIRIGVHSGLVIIESAMGSGAGLATVGAIGQTPNIAARLQELAAPGTILVTAATYGLTATSFNYGAQGETKIKGIEGNVAVFRPLRLRHTSSLRPASALAPRVDVRSGELAQLCSLWSGAIAGQGAVVLLTGEAGVGKTFLADQLVRQIKMDGGKVIAFSSQFDATYSPFRAVLAGLQRQFLLTMGSPPAKAQRLARLLRRFPDDADALQSLLGEFFLLPGVEKEALPKLTREGRQLLLRDCLLDRLARLRASRPIMIFVENAHWADPSSQEWLAELVRRARQLQIFLVVTARPDLQASWRESPAITPIRLDRLDRADQERILALLEGDQQLEPEIRQAILERSDGNPLYLEELFKICTGRDGTKEDKARAEAIPASLLGMLTAQLDRMGTAKRIALAASVIGREFSLDLLRELRPTDARHLEQGLSVLVEADLVRRRLERNAVTYSFKHALLREAAYEMLLSNERQGYHAKLAIVYPKLVADVTSEQPEIVARHASMGGLIDQAVALWRRAGLQALDRSAYREAASHLEQALTDSLRLSQPLSSPEEAQLCTDLAAAKIGAEGFASPDVERLSIRAYELCANLPNPAVRAAAIGGLTTYYQVRGPLSLARHHAEHLIELAHTSNDPGMLIRTMRRLGWCRFCIGDVREGRKMLADALKLYEERRERGLLHRREIDAGVIGFVNLAWAESFAGDAAHALAYCQASQSLAMELGERPADMAYAISMSASTHQVIGDRSSALALAERAQEIAARNALPYWTAWSKVLLGWGMIGSNPDRALPTILEGISAYAATGARLFVPYNLGLAAEAALALGRVRMGLDLIRQAERDTEETEVRFSEAGLRIARSGLLRAAGRGVEADQELGSADALARRQGSLIYVTTIEQTRRSLARVS